MKMSLASKITPRTPAGDQSGVLKAFARALTRESHVLQDYPDLLWQQLYNRLQWEGEELLDVIASEREQRCGSGAQPWPQIKTPYREAQSLLKTLTGHAARVNACAISPDGTWIVSASADNTLKIWDVGSGQEVRTLVGHTGGVNACAVSPDGNYILSVGGNSSR